MRCGRGWASARRCADCSGARRLYAAAERVPFALAANRALAPSSKLAAARWISEDVLVEALPTTTNDACYRAMDWLLEIRDAASVSMNENAVQLLPAHSVFPHPLPHRTGVERLVERVARKSHRKRCGECHEACYLCS